MNRLWPQRLCSAAFFLVLANSWHILLLKQQQDSPELLVARLAVAFGLALVCRSLASRSRPDCHTTLHKLWRKVGTPELVLLDALSRLGLVDATEESVPGDARFVVIPVGSSLRVTALYLSPAAEIEAAIAAGHISVIPLKRIR